MGLRKRASLGRQPQCPFFLTIIGVQSAPSSAEYCIMLVIFRRSPDERGGECLSSEYHGLMDKLEWRCAQNHVWTASFKSVYYTGPWCSTCANYRKKKFDIQYYQEASSAHGWKCLSTSYERVREPLHFECAAGHQVTITFSKALASDFHCPNARGQMVDASNGYCRTTLQAVPRGWTKYILLYKRLLWNKK